MGMVYFRRIAFAVSMLVWATVMLYIYQGEHVDAYLAKKFQTTLLVGGLATLVVGLFNLLTFRVEADCSHGGDCGHDHESSDLNPAAALLIILLPLVVALNWTEHKVSDDHLAKQTAQDVDPASMRFLANLPPFTKETLDSTRQKSADGFYQMNLFELFYSAGDSELERVFTGLKFETSGMLRAEPNRNADGKRMRLYRMFMTCCAADMKAIPMSVEFSGELPQFEENAWVLICGEMTYEHIDGVVYPVLKVLRVEEATAPSGGRMFK